MTVLGMHTQSELSDLVNAYETQYNDQKKAIVIYGDTHNPPSADWADFMTRWTAWSEKYRAAVADAKKSLGGSLASLIINSNPALSITEADSQYSTLSEVFKPATDFDRELRQKYGVSTGYSDTPQPTAPDADLQTLVVAQKITSPIVDPLVGDKSLAADKRKGFWGPVAVGAGIAVAAIALVKRVL